MLHLTKLNILIEKPININHEKNYIKLCKQNKRTHTTIEKLHPVTKIQLN